jgi:hypothetical protein
MNLRVLLTGVVMIVAALGFFFYMKTFMPRSNDPAEMMQIVGEVSGFVGALGLVMIVFGLFRKKRSA